jgi:DNA-binding NarL/FixJ family response regulator
MELRVLRALAEHGTMPAVARALHLSLSTVDHCVDQIRDKIGKRHQPELVAWLHEHGLAHDDPPAA